MTDAQVALGRRAVACAGWAWKPGMLTLDGWRILRVDEDGYRFAYNVKQSYAYAAIGDALPDLTDPATIGCVVAWLRTASGDPALYTVLAGGDTETGVWHVRWNTSSRRGRTEGEALVSAWEAIVR